MDSYTTARMIDGITRSEMAKAITLYATKILNQEPNTLITGCKEFQDISHINAELQ